MRAPILCDKTLGLGLSVADNRNRVRYPSLAKRAIAAKMSRESLSEEMRVLYVAMTRARDRLVMTYASRSLQTDLGEIALRYDYDGGSLLCREVSCPGKWVLKAAMERVEAGELFAIGGKPGETALSAFPWKIVVAQAPEVLEDGILTVQRNQMPPEGTEEMLQHALAFRYAHEGATKAPSKQTATQRKGREKDAEAAEDTEEPKMVIRNWRKPGFQSQQNRGKAYGSAIHAAMQYIRYDACGSEDGIREELLRLQERGFLTREQAEIVNVEAIAAFFDTDQGRKLREGAPHIREFKFSILDDASRYGPDLAGEEVLLQGVVDCALMEDDGITVLDFKTDHVTEETLPAVAARYRPQVEVYGDALSRIYEKPVKAMYLYFFHLGRFVELT